MDLQIEAGVQGHLNVPEGTSILYEAVGSFQQQDSGHCQWRSSPWRARDRAVAPLSSWMLDDKSGMLTTYLFGILPALHPSSPPAALAHALPIRELPRPQGPTLTCSVTPGLSCPDGQIVPSLPWELKEKELKGLGVRRP